MRSGFIFSGTDRFPSSHAAVICEIPGGDMLASWYAGSAEGAPDSVILGSRWSASCAVWSVPAVWVDVAGHAAGNPRLFIGPDGAVWLIAPINYGPGWCQGGTRLFLKRSYDAGETWTDLELFLTGKGILGKNKPLRVSASLWIIPVEHERTWQAAFLRSDDGGKKWTLIECPGGARVHQPSVVALEGGGLLAYMRTWEGRIFESRSTDGGWTWSGPAPTSLPNNNSGIDMVRLSDGAIAMAYNPVALGTSGDQTSRWLGKSAGAGRAPVSAMRRADEREMRRLVHGVHSDGEDSLDCLPWGPRTPLSVAVSRDEGRSWRIASTLEDGDGEYSYPAIVQDSAGTIHVVYTWQRTAIKHVLLEPDELSV
jgi:predicted neuraminidase